MKSSRLALGSILAVVVTFAFYAHGIWVGRFLEQAATSEYCSRLPLAFPATDWAWIPLSHRCRWADGTFDELVPAYVNAVLFIGLTTAVVCAVLAVRSARRDQPDVR